MEIIVKLNLKLQIGFLRQYLLHFGEYIIN